MQKRSRGRAWLRSLQCSPLLLLSYRVPAGMLSLTGAGANGVTNGKI